MIIRLGSAMGGVLVSWDFISVCCSIGIGWHRERKEVPEKEKKKIDGDRDLSYPSIHIVAMGSEA